VRLCCGRTVCVIIGYFATSCSLFQKALFLVN
jgi:hypothetical protein